MSLVSKSVLLFVLLILAGCSSEKKPSGRFDFIDKKGDVPAFSADSAYAYIQTQVDFGPRNPGSDGHANTLLYLSDELRRYSGGQVFVQRFQTEGYNETLSLANVIAAFNPSAQTRIMLCAHWDTRPRADRNQNPSTSQNPILGANDGASGIGVLLELARIFSENPPPIGVDIVLFDGEDYGVESDLDNYFLGSRHWSANPPVAGYMPRFSILLDMVGGANPRFPKEGFSMRYAAPVVDEVWSIASEMGHSSMFLNETSQPVADDHMILNQVYGLPTINIIHYPFPEYWHTSGDDMSHIRTETLQAVGDVLVELIYNRIPS